MSVAKLKAALKQVETAAKKGVAVLNEVSDNAFAHSPAAENPLEYVGWIANTLKAGIAELETVAKYEGLDEEAIVALKTQERADEAEVLRAAATAALEAYAAKPGEVPAEDDLEPDAAPNEEKPVA